MSSPASKSLTPVLRTSLVEEVIAAMQRMLGEENWSPGSKLPSEQELGRQLGVGRSTIREALRVLGHLGLVESRTGLGTYVVNRGMPHGRVEHPRTPEVLHELYEFRRSVEIPAASQAAERRTHQEMKRIRDAWRECEVAVMKDSPDEFARLDYEFHFSVVQAAHNRFSIDAYQGLKNVFAGYVNLILALGPLRSMLNFHDGLIDAIERQDPDAAASAVEQNFMETDVRLRLLLQGNGGGND
ncbi:MAG: FadR/GntR family transcriptional regulator [Pseudolabrys sp.]